MKIAVVLSTHIDCDVRVELLQSMIFSATVAQTHAQNIYPDVETRLFVRLSCVPEMQKVVETAMGKDTMPKLTIHPRQSQFQKIRSVVDSMESDSDPFDPQYYVFIDDDDIVAPTWLEQYIRYLQRIDEPLNPTAVVAETEYYYDPDSSDVTTLMWRDVKTAASGLTSKMDFSGICVSYDLVEEFLSLFESEIDSGLGTVDRSFTHRIRNLARYHIVVPEPLVYYRQWRNPRSWKSNAPSL